MRLMPTFFKSPEILLIQMPDSPVEKGGVVWHNREGHLQWTYAKGVPGISQGHWGLFLESHRAMAGLCEVSTSEQTSYTHAFRESSCSHCQRLGDTSAVGCLALLCPPLRYPRTWGMGTETSVQGGTSQSCLQVASQGTLLGLVTLSAQLAFMRLLGIADGLCAPSCSSLHTHMTCLPAPALGFSFNVSHAHTAGPALLGNRIPQEAMSNGLASHCWTYYPHLWACDGTLQSMKNY